MSCVHTGKPCTRLGAAWMVCECCRVPNAYGFFRAKDKHGREVWERRFVLADRRDQEVASLAGKIVEIKGQIERLWELPTKGEYNDELNGETSSSR